MTDQGRSPWQAAIERLLQDHGVLPDLGELVALKCDRDHLLACLAVLRDPDAELDTVTFWTGRDQRRLRAFISQLAECANQIESVNQGPFRGLLAETSNAALVDLPQQLRTYTEALQMAAYIGGRKKPGPQTRLFALVDYVIAQTGQPHDREVSSLVSAIMNREYSVEAHRQWRYEHYDRLKTLLKQG